jgi:hypothetical protein
MSVWEERGSRFLLGIVVSQRIAAVLFFSPIKKVTRNPNLLPNH